ncbi:hypothetical protein IIJ56_004032, partial [Salmonella enterica subsp. enterica serovar Oslo]|nr:hypothetical protein [Salmonella enterica subsp. enterica serovar Oslo]
SQGLFVTVVLGCTNLLHQGIRAAVDRRLACGTLLPCGSQGIGITFVRMRSRGSQGLFFSFGTGGFLLRHQGICTVID